MHGGTPLKNWGARKIGFIAKHPNKASTHSTSRANFDAPRGQKVAQDDHHTLRDRNDFCSMSRRHRLLLSSRSRPDIKPKKIPKVHQCSRIFPPPNNWRCPVLTVFTAPFSSG